MTDTDVLGASGASGPEILGIVWTLTAVAAVFLAARLFIKKRYDKGFWWDDQLLLASWGMLALFAATTQYCVSVGLGSHSQSSIVQSTPLQLSIVIATVFSVLGAAWSKTSFALTLLRITREGSRLLYWGIWCVVVTMNVVLVFNAILQFIWCAPPGAAWNAQLKGNCWDRNAVVKYTEFAAYYSAAMDFILATVPFAVIAKLSMRLKEKLGVITCMSLGVLSVHRISTFFLKWEHSLLTTVEQCWSDICNARGYGAYVEWERLHIPGWSVVHLDSRGAG